MFGDIDRARVLTTTATCIALITIGSWISIPFIPVPLTLQTLFVLLSGALLKRYGFLPPLTYLLLGVMNIPVFHNGLSGVGVLLGPTGGFIVGFIPAAAIVGLAYEQERTGVRFAGLAAGTLIIYLCGILWMVSSTGMTVAGALALGVLPFIPGDILKAAAAYLIERRVR
jgi:biotin transport system substrate-specific component